MRAEHHHDFRDAVVAVTGATGFVGTRVVARLLQLGAEVHGIARSGASPVDPRFRAHTVDLTHYDAVRAAIEAIRPDFVFHLAGHVTGITDLDCVIPAFRANLVSSVHLLNACAQARVRTRRIVLAGSLVEPPFGAGEAVPSSPYAAAKWAASGYARMFHALYGLPTSIARIFMVYGPAQRDGDKLVPHVVRALLAGRQPKVTSGRRLIDWIYVTDVVEGLLAIAQAPGVEGESVDLGSGQLIATREFLDRLADLVGGTPRPEFGALPDRPLEPVCCADVERSYRQTGWRPQVSIDEGLREVVAYYRHEAN